MNEQGEIMAVISDTKTITSFLKDLEQKATAIHSVDGLADKLKSGKRLVIKFGCDPSRPDLHLGHSVPLRQFKKFQELGHEIVFIIGDYTAMIGDPSGKNKTRPSLTLEQTRKSGETYFKQVTKILDPKLTNIVYNSEWLSKMNFADIIKLASKYTVARMLERDDFSKRFKTNVPISVHEFLYPLMQGYDSVAVKADIEIGGNDQTFNLLVGRELQRDYGQVPQEVITFPLLIGLDGKEKMSKSLNNYIGLNEPAEIMFEKCMKVPDNLLDDYFRLTTDIDAKTYKNWIAKDIRNAHFEYAREIVKLYHSEGSVAQAEKRYLEIATGGIPKNILEMKTDKKELNIIEMLIMAKFASSNSQARQLVVGNGVKVDGTTITDTYAVYDISTNPVLQKGKNNFVKFLN